MPRIRHSIYGRESDTWSHKRTTFEITYRGTDEKVIPQLIEEATSAKIWASHTLHPAEADGKIRLDISLRKATNKYAVKRFVERHTPLQCKVTVQAGVNASMPPQSLALTAPVTASPQLAPFSIDSQHFQPSPALVAKFMCSNSNKAAADKYIGLDTVASVEWPQSSILGEGTFGRVRNKGNALLME